MQVELSTQVHVGEGTISGDLDEVVTEGVDQHDKVWVVSFEVIVLGDMY